MQITEMKEEQKAVDMHRDFFDRTQFAIDNGFFIEAITMEYAAIESRLESICGQMGLPCGQKCPNRRDIKISHRIECLRRNRNQRKGVLNNTKLPVNFFTPNGELRKWIKQRDTFIHGLFKNAIEYQKRTGDLEECARKGMNYARALYNEAKFLQRMKRNHPWSFDIVGCSSASCKGYVEEQS